MLGFNLKERFKRMYQQYFSGDLTRAEEIMIENEFGDDLVWFKDQDEKTQKEIYFKLQAEKKSLKLATCPQILTDFDNTYFLQADEIFDDMLKNYKQDYYKEAIDVDGEIILALSNLSYLKKQDLNNASVKKKIAGCYYIVKTHIKNGYSVYHIIEILNKNIEEHKKKYPKDCEKGGIFYDRIVSDMNAIQTIELLEMHSPYAQFINASNHMGELVREQKDLEKQEKFDKADKIAETIEKLKEQLRIRFKSYDLDFLEHFLNDRKNYLKKDQTKQEEYLGSLEVLKTLVFNKKRENNL